MKRWKSLVRVPTPPLHLSRRRLRSGGSDGGGVESRWREEGSCRWSVQGGKRQDEKFFYINIVFDTANLAAVIVATLALAAVAAAAATFSVVVTFAAAAAVANFSVVVVVATFAVVLVATTFSDFLSPPLHCLSFLTMSIPALAEPSAISHCCLSRSDLALTYMC